MAISVSLGQYPYTYLRTTMMRRSLLKREDYDKLLKLSSTEISAYLQELEYKEQIDQLGVQYSGSELVERALTQNLGGVFEKLLRISPPELRNVLSLYLKRYEYENVKIVLRSKVAEVADDTLTGAFSALGVTSTVDLDALKAQKTPEDVIGALSMLSEADKKLALEAYAEQKSVGVCENLVDKAYFTDVLSKLSAMRGEGKMLKRFLLNEIDVFVVRMILQLKSEDVPEQSIRPLLMKGTLDESFYDRLVRLPFNEIIKELSKTSFKDALASLDENPTIQDVDKALDRYLLSAASKLIKQHPLSVDVIAGYAFMKQREVTNLMRIIKAKSLDLSDEFIAQVVVL